MCALEFAWINGMVTLRALSTPSGPGHVHDEGQNGNQAREHGQDIIQTIHVGLTGKKPIQPQGSVASY